MYFRNLALAPDYFLIQEDGEGREYFPRSRVKKINTGIF
jgi:hypothetical protein